jgi:predicted CDP-diglyceride synthetase/phosphatidate cytidylyltransferase
LLNRWGVNDWARLLFNNTITGIAGLISILAVGIIASSIGPRLTWLTPQAALLSGLIIGAAAYVGSATVHAVQHALYISDDDALIPGMGGIITFIYPFVYAAPLFFFLLLALEH